MDVLDDDGFVELVVVFVAETVTDSDLKLRPAEVLGRVEAPVAEDDDPLCVAQGGAVFGLDAEERLAGHGDGRLELSDGLHRLLELTEVGVVVGVVGGGPRVLWVADEHVHVDGGRRRLRLGRLVSGGSLATGLARSVEEVSPGLLRRHQREPFLPAPSSRASW